MQEIIRLKALNKARESKSSMPRQGDIVNDVDLRSSWHGTNISKSGSISSGSNSSSSSSSSSSSESSSGSSSTNVLGTDHQRKNMKKLARKCIHIKNTEGEEYLSNNDWKNLGCAEILNKFTDKMKSAISGTL